MSTLVELSSASLEATALALLAVFLYQAHRQAGIVPLLFLVAALALLVPLGAHASSLQFGDQGVAPRVYAIVVPVFLALTLLLHILVGSRTAVVTAALPVAAGMLSSLVTLASGVTDLVIPQALIPPDPVSPFLGGATLSVGALAAVYIFHGLTRTTWDHPIASWVVPAALVGTGLQGILLFGANLAGAPSVDVQWPAIAAVPVIVGFVPVLLVGLYIQSQAGRLDPEERRELVSRSPFGSETMVEAYERARRMYHEGLVHGRSVAAKYLELLESQPVGTYVCDTRGRLSYANMALSRILGREEDDLTGQNISHLLGSTGNTGRPKPAREAIQPGTHKMAVVLPSGHKRLVELQVETTSEGKLRGHITDLTHEMVRLELERQRQRASFYLDLLSENVASHVHPTRRALAELLEDPGLLDRQRGPVEAARDALSTIGQLTDHVDMLSRAERVEPTPMEAQDLIKRTAERARDRLGEDWEVSTKAPSQAVVFKGSPMLAEALDILIDTAASFGEPHHGLLVELEARGSVGWLVTIQYAGQAPPEDEVQVLEGEATPEGNGRRLGYYAVRTLLSNLGGWVRVETGALKGSGREISLSVHVPTAAVDPAAWRTGAIGSAEQARS